ncbi:hypothetical protein OH76DRAFT_1395343 [Lentinus brumalis]|uniref:Uncharacterized protein n=1 Tax=Lentinus brumalis TaxID=2498619 RepID=A0A371DYA1_9APHY|nr:hypothetical protein OH76DRAFT_1395343 [Polyporus brumalis]
MARCKRRPVCLQPAQNLGVYTISGAPIKPVWPPRRPYSVYTHPDFVPSRSACGQFMQTASRGRNLGDRPRKRGKWRGSLPKAPGSGRLFAH